MIRKTISFLFLLFVFCFSCTALDVPVVSAQSAVLMVADTKELVFAKNEHLQRGIASTTKIMTALLTLECATPEKQVTVTEKMAAVEGTSMGLLPGDKVTYRDLVYGMMLASGNDAANTAAISISGSIQEFAELMNNRAQQIGMMNTSFITPSGLDADNHYSTAYDMALLACEAIKNPDFLLACSSVQARLCYGNEPYTRYLSNHNKLLKTFDGAVGVKTGFTKKSGRCLVSAAERNGVTLICVTLNAPDDWHDHKTLLEYGFDRVSVKNIDCELPLLNVFGGNVKSVGVELSQPLDIATLCNSDRISVQITVKPYTVAPLKKGDIAGEVRITVDGKPANTIPVIVKEDVCATTKEVFEKPSIIKRIADKLSELFCQRKVIT